jgi:hypothetical protein
MKNIIGSIVEKENFFGREKEIERAWELIEDGNSLILAAPRRVGKSSFAKKLIATAKGKGWSSVYLNLEGIAQEADFIDIFVSQLTKEKWYEKLGNFLETIKLSAKDITVEWNSKKTNIYRELEDNLVHDKDTLIVVDELTIFLNNLRKEQDKAGLIDVNFFLHWLRNLRQVSDTKIRWIFCSSIGIESFTNKHNLSKTINDVTPFKIDELKGNEPELCIKELAKEKNLDFSDKVIRCMLDKLNWYLPYFIQILFKGIVNLHKLDGEKISVETVEKAYKELINSAYFNTWDERLSDYPEDEIYARLILNELSKSKKGITRNGIQTLIFGKTNDEDKADAIATQLLLRLKNDGYIMFDEKGKKYVFRSPLLRDFWYNKFIK